jgi:hypothetical protein
MTYSLLRSPRHDLADRRPVWDARSVLFLDTELTDQDIAAVATILAQSPYDDEIAAIYHAEVAPVYQANIGMDPRFWACFSDSWVEHAILARDVDAAQALPNRQSARRSPGAGVDFSNSSSCNVD